MVLDTLRGYPQKKLVCCCYWLIKIIHLDKILTNLKVKKNIPVISEPMENLKKNQTKDNIKDLLYKKIKKKLFLSYQ